MAPETASATPSELELGPPDLSMLPGFTAADLAINEMGALSHDQRQRVRNRLDMAVFGIALMVAITAFVAWSGGYLTTVFYGILTLALTVKVTTGYFELRNPQVACYEGDAWAESDNDESPSYTIHIADVELDTTSEVYRRFLRGGPYRIYALRGSSFVVSVQPLSNWRSLPEPPRKKSWWHGLTFEIG